MKALLLSLLLAITALAADEPPTGKSLAQVIEEHGVTEKLNTFGHASERTAANLEGRAFSLDAAELRTAVWQALRQSRYVETRREEPDGPYIFAVLNTGSKSFDPPIEEFWVDAEGFAYFLIDHNVPKKGLWVFRSPELRKLLVSYAKTFGTPPR